MTKVLWLCYFSLLSFRVLIILSHLILTSGNNTVERNFAIIKRREATNANTIKENPLQATEAIISSFPSSSHKLEPATTTNNNKQQQLYEQNDRTLFKSSYQPPTKQGTIEILRCAKTTPQSVTVHRQGILMERRTNKRT